MNVSSNEKQYDTIIVGGGQAGLAIGYYLARQGRNFLVLDAHERIGDAWRKRWDSLRLFTRAKLDGLPGMPFPAPPDSYPTKDEMANYLETYAARFSIPVQLNTPVESLAREATRYILTAKNQRFEADRVVVAMSAHQIPHTPPFSEQLDPKITQLHTKAYRNPGQLSEGDTLVVGAGNSGAEIALDLKKSWSGKRVWLAGRDTGHIPNYIKFDGPPFWFIINSVFTIRTHMGRAAAKSVGQHMKGTLLARVKPQDLVDAGIERVPRAKGVHDGRPILDDGRILDVNNIIWSTGFTPNFDWIRVPVFGDNGYPMHERGIVKSEPGLYFLGLPFTYGLTSGLVGGVGRDARYIAEHIESTSLDGERKKSIATPLSESKT